jgi:hypothetical protein
MRGGLALLAMAVTREELYEEVWAEPMTMVAARYGVSSSFMARVCDRLNVPQPHRGYWAQLKVGQAPPNAVLPNARPGDELEWSRQGEPHKRSLALPTAPARPARRKSRSVHAWSGLPVKVQR